MGGRVGAGLGPAGGDQAGLRGVRGRGCPRSRGHPPQERERTRGRCPRRAVRGRRGESDRHLGRARLGRIRRRAPPAQAGHRAVAGVRFATASDRGGPRADRGAPRGPRGGAHGSAPGWRRRSRNLRDAPPRLTTVAVKAVISDFGGVLTTPLLGSFMALQDEIGIEPGTLGRAMQRIAEHEGEHPLFELERGLISEADFLENLSRELEPELGHRPQLSRFSEIYFDALEGDEQMIGVMRRANESGFRMALLTNNIREWKPLWRAMLPVDEIFELVVDSAFVGIRKPEPEIYELTLERLGGLAPEAALFVDDVEVNCEAAREPGFRVVHFRDSEQAIGEVEAALAT